jgi:hypothetical protein
MLRDGRWSEAQIVLSDMRRRGVVPKLGSVQRWVRDIDAAGGDDPQALMVLDAVLRTSDPMQIGYVMKGGIQRKVCSTCCFW